MKESESSKEYSDKLLGISNKIRLLGTPVSDSRIVQKILVTIPERYEAAITTLENTKELSNITLAELLNALHAQDQRRLTRQECVVEGALPAKHQVAEKSKKKYQNRSYGRNSKKSYPPCHHCNKVSHPPFKCWRRPDAKCNKCNQLGHEAVICNNEVQSQNEAAQIADEEEVDQMFVASCFLTTSSSEGWLIDSGRTNYMTFDKTIFEELRPSNVKKTRIGNRGYLFAKEIGTIVITTSSGTKTIADVLYVPEIDQNLLSVGQLLEKGFKVSFENFNCYIFYTSGKEVLKVKMKGKSFAYESTEVQIAYVTISSNTEIWHKRLGHCHLQRMMRLQKSDMVRGLTELDNYLPNCISCQSGKQNRLPFAHSTWRASKKLQLIHTDVAGPQRTPSLQGSRYYILFIDDFTRMCWIYFLQFKSEVASVQESGRKSK